jgi:hypothetical protein
MKARRFMAVCLSIRWTVENSTRLRNADDPLVEPRCSVVAGVCVFASVATVPLLSTIDRPVLSHATAAVVGI